MEKLGPGCGCYYCSLYSVWFSFGDVICFSVNCREPIINQCPVCGEALQVSDKLNTMIHLTLCFDEGTGNQVMTGGFLTDKQASSG